jgi:hypothetical protein
MKKENLIWLAVGGLAVYLFLQSRKKTTSQPAEVKEVTPTPPPNDTTGGISGVKPASLLSNKELSNALLSMCVRGGARRLITPEVENYRASIRIEAEKRGIKVKCPDYGKYLPS